MLAQVLLVERVHDGREEAQLRLLRPAHDGRLVAVAVHPERGRGRARLRGRRPTATSCRRRGWTSTTSTATSSHGVHVAAMAGSWVSLVYGFAGLRDDDGAIVVLAAPADGAGTGCAFRLLRRRRRTLAGHDHPPRGALRGLVAATRSRSATSGGRSSVAPGAPVAIGLDPPLAGRDLRPRRRASPTPPSTTTGPGSGSRRRCRCPFDRELNERLKGVSRMESLDIILEQRRPDREPRRQGPPRGPQERLLPRAHRPRSRRTTSCPGSASCSPSCGRAASGRRSRR